MRSGARLRGLLASALLGAAGLAAALPPAGAHAATPVVDATETQVIADTAHGHLFISQNNDGYPAIFLGSNSIVVTDLAGKPVAALPDPYSSEDMALSPDGKSLYVGAASGGVDVFSTATLAQTATYDAPGAVGGLVIQGGLIWVSYQEFGGLWGVGAINESTGALTTDHLPASWVHFPPVMAADPGDSGVIVTSSVGVDPPTVASYNVSNPALVTVMAQSSLSNWLDCGAWHGLSVLPGGTMFSCDGAVLSTATLSPATTPVPPGGSIYAPNGTTAYATGFTQYIAGNPDVFVLPAGVTDPSDYRTEFTLPDTSTGYVSDLAWSADASQLFAVVQDVALTPFGNGYSASDSSYSVEALDARGMTTLAMNAPTSPADGSVALSGQATSRAAGVEAPLAGARVTITRTATGAIATSVPPEKLTATTSADGTFTVRDTFPALGTYGYTASYAGDAASAPSASGLVAVTAAEIVPALSVSANVNPVAYGGTVTVTAHLGTTYTNRTVSIYATPAGQTARVIKTGVVNAAGNLAVTAALTRNTTFTATFSGDAHDTSARASRLIGVQVKMATALSGYYTSTLLSGVLYRVYHHTATLQDSVTVTPDKYRSCVELQVQRYYDRAWRAVTTTGCYHLNSVSRATLALRLGATGQYRARVSYIHATTDILNVSTDSAWLGYEVVR